VEGIKLVLKESKHLDKRLEDILEDIYVSRLKNINEYFEDVIERMYYKFYDHNFGKEKTALNNFFDHIAKGTGLSCFGIRHCLSACKIGAVLTLLIWEKIDFNRYVLQTPQGEKVMYLTSNQETMAQFFKDPVGQPYEIIDQRSLLDWILDIYPQYGCKVQGITDMSQEALYFVKGYYGIGAILFYPLNWDEIGLEEEMIISEDESPYDE